VWLGMVAASAGCCAVRAVCAAALAVIKRHPDGRWLRNAVKRRRRWAQGVPIFV
jgi:hypothetical protein